MILQMLPWNSMPGHTVRATVGVPSAFTGPSPLEGSSLLCVHANPLQPFLHVLVVTHSGAQLHAQPADLVPAQTWDT